MHRIQESMLGFRDLEDALVDALDFYPSLSGILNKISTPAVRSMVPPKKITPEDLQRISEQFDRIEAKLDLTLETLDRISAAAWRAAQPDLDD